MKNYFWIVTFLALCGLQTTAFSQVSALDEPEGVAVYRVAEEMPRFPGDGCEDLEDRAEVKVCSDKAMLEFIYQNLDYPTLAVSNGTEGTVVIQFIVEKDGTLSDIKAVRKIGDGCEEAAVDVIELMNDLGMIWTPGIQRSEEIRVRFNLPVMFRLP